jgi:thiamine transport system substrate-binding protein
LRTQFSYRPLSRALVAASAVVIVLGSLAACGSDDGADAAAEPTTTSSPVLSGTVTLVTYDSFALSKKTLKQFEDQTGVKVKVLQNGDAGKMVNTAILTKNRPQGDVMFGVDSTFVSKALDGGIFAPYKSPELQNVEPAYLLADGEDRVTPVDHGEVCVNYDKDWYAEKNLTPPATFDDLVKPDYKGQLVVENPATSSPGLAFLMATVAEKGEDGWVDYWQQLKDNDVDVQPGWDEAYYSEFTAGGGGPRPLVVSYSSSPAAVVDFAEKPLDDAPTAVLEDTCFGTVEYAGVLEGAKNPDAARALVDFLLSETVQADIPPNMYVYPVRRDTPLPESFTKHAKPVVDPLTLDASVIDENREDWTRTWQRTVIG